MPRMENMLADLYVGALIRAGATAPKSELQRLAHFVYKQYNFMESMIIDHGETTLFTEWYKIGVNALIDKYIPD